MSFHMFQIATVLALWGVVISAVYMLRAYRAVFMGAAEPRTLSGLGRLPDLSRALRRADYPAHRRDPHRRLLSQYRSTPAAADLFAAHCRDRSMIPAPALEIAVLLWGLILLLAESFAGKTDRRGFAIAGIAGLFVVLVASFFLAPPPAAALTGFWSFYAADPLAIFFKRFALVTTILVLIMAIDYAPAIRMGVPGANPHAGLGEFFTLPIFTCAGLMWMASAIDFVMIFVSLELVTMSFYVLVSFTRRNPATLEAGVKYLILSALSTGFLVYGITWIFGVTGETNLARIGTVLATQDIDRIPLLFGIALVLVALGFKIAAVPFQIWVPDVYQGAPTPVTAFLSVGSKAAGFVVLLRVLGPVSMFPQVGRLLVGVAALTLIYGNFAALPQSNLKRLLAYSSIAHAGYLLYRRCQFFRSGGRLLSRRLPAHDAALFCRAHRRRETAAENRSTITRASRNVRPFSPSRC